jgi:hypothetical protein
MKLNFWQWLGVLLLIIGGGLYIYRNYIQSKPDPKPAPPPPAAVQPATPPATGPAAPPTQPVTQPGA